MAKLQEAACEAKQSRVNPLLSPMFVYFWDRQSRYRKPQIPRPIYLPERSVSPNPMLHVVTETRSVLEGMSVWFCPGQYVDVTRCCVGSPERLPAVWRPAEARKNCARGRVLGLGIMQALRWVMDLRSQPWFPSAGASPH